MCSEVFNNQLESKLKDLDFKIDFSKYNPEDTLKGIIEKPCWVLDIFKDEADYTYIPDIISIYGDYFIIFDAKYYNLKFEKEKILGQPGIESISKQYFYDLAYRDFINDNKKVRNAFLFPTDNEKIENIGHVEMKMFSNLGLEDIQAIMLPAHKINKMYLHNEKMDVSELEKFLKLISEE